MNPGFKEIMSIRGRGMPEADEVTVTVDENSNTRLRMTLGSISRVLGEEPATSGEVSK